MAPGHLTPAWACATACLGIPLAVNIGDAMNTLSVGVLGYIVNRDV
jgi:hypothetical protein